MADDIYDYSDNKKPPKFSRRASTSSSDIKKVLLGLLDDPKVQQKIKELLYSMMNEELKKAQQKIK